MTSRVKHFSGLRVNVSIQSSQRSEAHYAVSVEQCDSQATECILAVDSVELVHNPQLFKHRLAAELAVELSFYLDCFEKVGCARATASPEEAANSCNKLAPACLKLPIASTADKRMGASAPDFAIFSRMGKASSAGVLLSA